MRSFREVFPSNNHPSGQLILAITREFIITSDGHVAVKTCPRCGRVRYAPEFLNHSIPIGGRVCIVDSAFCYECLPRQPIPFHVDAHGDLAMHLSMHDEYGRPYWWWDKATTSWLPLHNAGLRRMKRSGNIIRLQPRTERNLDANGVPYKTRQLFTFASSIP